MYKHNKVYKTLAYRPILDWQLVSEMVRTQALCLAVQDISLMAHCPQGWLLGLHFLPQWVCATSVITGRLPDVSETMTLREAEITH